MERFDRMRVPAISGLAADLAFAAKRRVLGAYQARRAHVYCVGAGKSGTHSIAALFGGTVRVRHEPQAGQLIDKILAWRGGALSQTQITDWIRERDRRLALEVDSSFLNFDLIEILLREFPEARFILTLRDCYSWLESALNHMARVRDTIDPRWIRIWDLRFRTPESVHAPEERVLKENRFASLDNYFGCWAARNGHVLERVPPERLFVVRTDEITKRAYEIAEFAGLPRRVVRPERAHAYANPVKAGYLRQIPREFLESKAQQHCESLMNRYFPEIRCLDDTFPNSSAT